MPHAWRNNLQAQTSSAHLPQVSRLALGALAALLGALGALKVRLHQAALHRLLARLAVDELLPGRGRLRQDEARWASHRSRGQRACTASCHRDPMRAAHPKGVLMRRRAVRVAHGPEVQLLLARKHAGRGARLARRALHPARSWAGTAVSGTPPAHAHALPEAHSLVGRMWRADCVRRLHGRARVCRLLPWRRRRRRPAPRLVKVVAFGDALNGLVAARAGPGSRQARLAAQRAPASAGRCHGRPQGHGARQAGLHHMS